MYKHNLQIWSCFSRMHIKFQFWAQELNIFEVLICDSVCIQAQTETQATVASDIPQFYVAQKVTLVYNQSLSVLCMYSLQTVQAQLTLMLHQRHIYFDQKSNKIGTPTTCRNWRRLNSLACQDHAQSKT